MKEYFDQCYMEDYVRINHFRNHYEVRSTLMTFCYIPLEEQHGTVVKVFAEGAEGPWFNSL